MIEYGDRYEPELNVPEKKLKEKKNKKKKKLSVEIPFLKFHLKILCQVYQWKVAPMFQGEFGLFNEETLGQVSLRKRKSTAED
ncbi:hypothetical protein ABLB84_11495 [Xenorhabdus szentirmaii]